MTPEQVIEWDELVVGRQNAELEAERLRMGICVLLEQEDSRAKLRAALRRLLEGVNP